jgi:hypothetical protein
LTAWFADAEVVSRVWVLEPTNNLFNLTWSSSKLCWSTRFSVSDQLGLCVSAGSVRIKKKVLPGQSLNFSSALISLV